MRIAWLFLALCCPSFLSAAGEDTPTAIAQKLFDAMKAHDSTAASALFLPGATLSSVDDSGKASVIPFEKFAEHIGASKSAWLERISNPKVLQQGPISVVWAEYDFYLNGKLSHCGIDSFSLLKTQGGWKIAAISDTRKTSNCKPSP